MKGGSARHNGPGGPFRRPLLWSARLLPLLPLPLLRLAWGLLRQDFAILTANPVEKLIDTFGWWTLALLGLSRAMAPLQRPAAALGVVHFAWKAKVGFRDPRVLLLAPPVAALLLVRIPWRPRWAARAQ